MSASTHLHAGAYTYTHCRLSLPPSLPCFSPSSPSSSPPSNPLSNVLSFPHQPRSLPLTVTWFQIEESRRPISRRVVTLTFFAESRSALENSPVRVCVCVCVCVCVVSVCVCVWDSPVCLFVGSGPKDNTKKT